MLTSERSDRKAISIQSMIVAKEDVQAPHILKKFVKNTHKKELFIDYSSENHQMFIHVDKIKKTITMYDPYGSPLSVNLKAIFKEYLPDFKHITNPQQQNSTINCFVITYQNMLDVFKQKELTIKPNIFKNNDDHEAVYRIRYQMKMDYDWLQDHIQGMLALIKEHVINALIDDYAPLRLLKKQCA